MHSIFMDFFGSQMVLFLFSGSSKRDAKAIFFEKMYLGTFLCLVRSLATIYIFARVRIIGTLVPRALMRSVFMYFITLKY